MRRGTSEEEKEIKCMIRTELKRVFCSKSFWWACVITLALLAYGSRYDIYSRRMGVPTAWWQIYLRDSMMGPLSLFYPTVVMIPYVLSYRRERDSGYMQLILLKTTRKTYLWSKVLAVAVSAFMTMLLTTLCWIPVCRLIGVADPAYDNDRHNIFFALSLYDQHPGLYCVMYAVHAAVLGAVFAILGLGLSAVIKNRYLAVLLPFCYCIFSSSILSALIGSSFAALDLLPLQLYHSTKYYPLGYWTAPIYEVILTVTGLVLFFGGDIAFCTA